MYQGIPAASEPPSSRFAELEPHLSPAEALGLILRDLQGHGRLHEWAPRIQGIALFVSHLEHRCNAGQIRHLTRGVVASFLGRASSFSNRLTLTMRFEAVHLFLAEAIRLEVAPINALSWVLPVDGR